MPSFTSVRALAVLALLVVAGLAAWLWLAGGGDDAADAALANAETLDWSDLIPPRQSAAAVRTRDGNLPRGVVQHGELGPAGPPGPGERVLVVPPDLATTLGGTGNLDAPARRLSDALGGLGNLKALQPRGGEARAELDGRLVRMAGFVAPLAFQGSRISQFLLVPYVGACIHVPPPPANQIVLVTGLRGYRPDNSLLYPVWVTGTLRAAKEATELADAAYRIDDARVERYQEAAP